MCWGARALTNFPCKLRLFFRPGVQVHPLHPLQATPTAKSILTTQLTVLRCVYFGAMADNYVYVSSK